MSTVVRTETTKAVIYTVTPTGGGLAAVITLFKESPLHLEYAVPWSFVAQKTWQEYDIAAMKGGLL